MKPTFKIMFVALALFSSGRSFSQDLLGGIDFVLGIPKGEFSRNIDNNGYGGSLLFGYAPESDPFFVGIEGAYLVYGSDTRREPFSTTIPDVTVDVTTTNAIVLAHLIVRLQPNTGGIRPYLEGSVGLNYLFTETKIENRGIPGQEVASSINQSDVAFSYGPAGGVMFRVYEATEGERLSEVLIDIRVRYLWGGDAEYLKEGSIRRQGVNVAYDTYKSKTDLLTIQLGGIVRF